MRVLIMGDSGVGKSSLISAFISRQCPDVIQPLLADSVVPQGRTSSLTITDSSARPGDRDVLHQKILNADTILLLFDTTRPETLESAISNWLPMIALTCESGTAGRTRVSLVGTKKDKLTDEENERREREEVPKVRALLVDFPFIHAYQRCSAKTLENVDTVMYVAELSVTFPLSPLYDSETSCLTLRARRAFQRVFRIIDADNDGFLSDDEMNSLQLKVFDETLPSSDLAGIKTRVAKLAKCGSSGLSPDDQKITLGGFLGLLELFLENFNPQVPWAILQRFGYNESLELVDNSPPSSPRDASAINELAPDAEEFLRNLAVNATRACPAASGEGLSRGALDLVLSVLEPEKGSTTPWSTLPFFEPQMPDETHRVVVLPANHSSQRLVGTDSSAAVLEGLDDWISHWQLLALHCPSSTEQLLFSLGYAERSDSGLKLVELTRPAGPPMPKKKRGTVSVGIMGSSGVGKASLVFAMTGRPAWEHAAQCAEDPDLGLPQRCHPDVQYCGGRLFSCDDDEGGQDADYFTENILPMFRSRVCICASSVPYSCAAEWVTSNKCVSSDAIALLFDITSVESFQAALRIEALLPQNVPRIFVASKADLALAGETSKGALQLALSHVAEHQLPAVIVVSSKVGAGVDLLRKSLLQLSASPWTGIPIGIRQRRESAAMQHRFLLVGAAATVVAIAAFAIGRQRGAHR